MSVPALSSAILDDLTPSERHVYDHICAAGNKGMWSQDLRNATKLPGPVLSKLTRALVQRGVLKEVPDARHRAKKVFMDARIEPATGGASQHDAQLDTHPVLLNGWIGKLTS